MKKLTFLLIFFCLIVGCENKPTNSATEELSRRKLRELDIENQFSPTSGAHYRLAEYVRSKMTNPDDFIHIFTIHFDMGDYLLVYMTYADRNSSDKEKHQNIGAEVTLKGAIRKILPDSTAKP